jgi:DNA (cytosine-5)-methyltransferase 1
LSRSKTLRPIPVVDIFAGPGGLSEGFSAYRDGHGRARFRVSLSVEKDPFAYETLRLRNFFRQFPDGNKPQQYYSILRSGKCDWDVLQAKYPNEAERATREVWKAELGTVDYSEVDKRIAQAIGGAQLWILIGGPPCQAYSTVGRSRLKNKKPWHFARDPKHTLYKEYLRILAIHRPPVFVMENVKGILSSKKAGKLIIHQILGDLRQPLDATNGHGLGQKSLTYKLYPLCNYRQASTRNEDPDDPAEYIIRCEEHGIPQARHRLIILGVRSDLEVVPGVLPVQKSVNLWTVLRDLPKLRSQLSRGEDSATDWVSAIQRVTSGAILDDPVIDDELRTALCRNAEELCGDLSTGSEYLRSKRAIKWRSDWFHDELINGVIHHSTRGHIEQDLQRYFYAACFAQVHGCSPILSQFPKALMPDHENVKNGNSEARFFADRFRVQPKNKPSTTVTSHIRKDGHYFIHPDPSQCRSLTVREAARLQTFPDNYYFIGGRTAQYQQVGNAVPPLLAMQIAAVVHDLIEHAWKG